MINHSSSVSSVSSLNRFTALLFAIQVTVRRQHNTCIACRKKVDESLYIDVEMSIGLDFSSVDSMWTGKVELG